MPANKEDSSARALARMDGSLLEVSLEGTWRMSSTRPRWEEVVAGRNPQSVRLVGTVQSWDSSLLVFIADALGWCESSGLGCDLGQLPEKLQTLAAQFGGALSHVPSSDRAESFLVGVGVATQGAFRQAKDMVQFIGECSLSALRLVVRPRLFRWRDCLSEMQHCGAMALPIVSLISFLVGLTLAYSGAIVLRQFGGDIWVADIVGVTMTREMGAVMTAVVLAGRTGAAFAAQIGSMKANEEIDALSTLGIPAVRFLVIPRIVALGLMMPLLAIYSNCLGMLGGMAVARGILNIPPAAYWVEMLSIVDMSDISVGMIKAVVFGMIVGISGCLRGLQAERSAEGVGRAATSAVVTSILFIIIADALFAVIFNILGL